jgi:hypothetical protein
MRVIIDPESGWFGSLPAATQDFVMRKVTKAQVDRRYPIELHVTGTGVMRHSLPGSVADPKRLDAWPVLGAKLAHSMRLVPPWRGASEGR